jgi:hypothetical protein
MRWHQPRPPRTSPSEASRKSAGCPLDFTTGFFVRAEGGKLPCVRHWKWHRMHSSFGIRCPGSRAIRFRIRRLYDFERALFSTVFDLPVPSSGRSCQVQWRRHRQPMMSARGAGLVCGGPRRLLGSPQVADHPLEAWRRHFERWRVFRQLDEPNWNQRAEFTSILSTSLAISDLIYVSAWPLELYDIRRSRWETKARSSLQICAKSRIDGNPSTRCSRLRLNACHWLPRSFSLFEEKIFADGTDVRLNVGSWCRFPETGLFPSEDARLVRCGPEAVGLSRLGVGVDRMGSWHRRTALIGKEHSE